MWRPTGISFRAQAQDGRRFEITEDIEVVDTLSTRPSDLEPGRRTRLRTSDGYKVNPLNDEMFEVVGVQPYLETVRVNRC
jgi:hypothetical protein